MLGHLLPYVYNFLVVIESFLYFQLGLFTSSPSLKTICSPESIVAPFSSPINACFSFSFMSFNSVSFTAPEKWAEIQLPFTAFTRSSRWLSSKLKKDRIRTIAIVAFGKPFEGSLSFDFEGWFIIILLAIPGGSVMFLAWGRALQMISPTQAAIATGFNPVTAILLGAWLLSEPVSLRLLSGFALVIVAILISTRDSKINRPPVQV